MSTLLLSTTKKVMIVSIILLLSLLIRLWIIPFSTDTHDLMGYKYWGQSAVDYGIQRIYSGDERNPAITKEYPLTYPPILIYFFGASYQIYKKLIGEEINIESSLLSFLIKFPMVLFDLFLSIFIFLFINRKLNFQSAILSMASYALNPAVIYDTACWGQADVFHSLFILLAIIYLIEKKPSFPGFFITLAIFTKPQAWVFTPVILLFTLRKFGIKQLFKGILIGFLTTVVIFFPFIYFHTLPKAFLLFVQLSAISPFLSCKAHNIWWLLSLGHMPFISDLDLFLNLISYRTIGLLLFGSFFIFALFKLWNSSKFESICNICAFLGCIFFMLPTRIHENHMFVIFPFLSLIWFLDKRIKYIYILLSITFLGNLIPISRFFQVLNALVNTIVLIYWTYILFQTKESFREHPLSSGQIKKYVLWGGGMFSALSGIISLNLILFKNYFILIGHHIVEGAYYSGWEKTLPLKHYLILFNSMYNQLIYGLIGISLVLIIGTLGYYLYHKQINRIKGKVLL